MSRNHIIIVTAEYLFGTVYRSYIVYRLRSALSSVYVYMSETTQRRVRFQ